MRKLKIVLKTLIFLLTLVMAVVLFKEYNLFNKNVVIRKCEADVLYDVYEGNVKLTLDVLYVLAFEQKNKGFLHVSGVLNKDGEKIDLDRTYYFSLENNKKIGFYSIKIDREKISAFDFVDSKLLYEKFLPKPGEDYYIKATSPNKELLFFEGLVFPFFICASNLSTN